MKDCPDAEHGRTDRHPDNIGYRYDPSGHIVNRLEAVWTCPACGDEYHRREATPEEVRIWNEHQKGILPQNR